MEKELYMQEYEKFMRDYKSMEVTGEQVGELVMRMSQYFSEANIKKTQKERARSIVAAQIEQSTDDNGKPISSSKAKVLTEATVEDYDYNMARCHCENLEQHLNSLKSLQKGLINEFQYATK